MNKLAFDQAKLAQDYGIIFMGAQKLALMDREQGAYDAQPALVTAANAGILSLFTTYVDPELIKVHVAPVMAEVLYGGRKYGDWVTDTAAFPVVERVGVTTSYGDFNEGGTGGYNVNWPQRQSYHWQSFARWGERELERAAKARIDWANGVNEGVALAMKKFENLSYLFGVANLQNYGGTNDPSLPPAIAATTNWYNTTDPTVIFNDVLRMVQQAVIQSQGLLNAKSKFKLGISPQNAMNLNKTNQFNYNVLDQMAKNFNIEIVAVPEFATSYAGSEFMQLIPERVEGQKVTDSAFTEKMRAHAMITMDSGWRQKKSQGTWGTVVYQPAYIVAMHF